MEKTPIREESLAQIFAGSRLELDMRNDIYSTYRLQAPSHLNGTARNITNRLDVLCT